MSEDSNLRTNYVTKLQDSFLLKSYKKKKKLGQFHNPRPKIYQGKKFSTIPQIKGAVYASIVKKGNNGKEEREGVRNKECWKNN